MHAAAGCAAVIVIVNSEFRCEIQPYGGRGHRAHRTICGMHGLPAGYTNSAASPLHIVRTLPLVPFHKHYTCNKYTYARAATHICLFHRPDHAKLIPQIIKDPVTPPHCYVACGSKQVSLPTRIDQAGGISLRSRSHCTASQRRSTRGQNTQPPSLHCCRWV